MINDYSHSVVRFCGFSSSLLWFSIKCWLCGWPNLRLQILIAVLKVNFNHCQDKCSLKFCFP